MTVHCPHCSTGYLLPSHLIGARGTRVRCPNCQGSFVVLPDGPRERASDVLLEGRRGGDSESATGMAAVMDDAPTATESGSREERSAAGPNAEDSGTLAAAIVEELAVSLGDRWADARRARRVFSEHGPAIVEAFDEYRRRAGPGASPAPFQLALKARGLDLMPRGTSKAG